MDDDEQLRSLPLSLSGDRQKSGAHVFTSFFTIVEDYIQLFISQMFPVIV